MKKKQKQNFSGIRVCDSIVMSVKNRNINLRRLESLIIAVVGYISTIMVFFTMFDFNYNKTPVIISAVIFSIVYILLSNLGKNALWLIIASIGVVGAIFWKMMNSITLGYKFVYNTIYKASYLTEINYYKFLDSTIEAESVTTFFIFGIWFLAIIIYVFTIYHPHPLPPLITAFPILEIGLYNGIDVSIFWGMMVISFLIACFAMSTIDMGEYSGGTGGFVRKGNMFLPKRQMRLKVTEKCGVYLILLIMTFTGLTVGVMKLSDYKRSKELNVKRSEIRDAVENFSTENLAESITELSAALGFEFKIESHKLGNIASMKYKNSDDLKITMDRASQNAIYLKEYTCAVYGNNEWTSLPESVYNNSIFNDFERYNVFPQDFPHRFNLTLDNYNGDYTIKIQSLLRGNRSFSPYGTDNLGGLSYDRDLTVSSKKRNKKDYFYKFTNADAEIASMYLDLPVRNVINLNMISDEEKKQDVIKYCSEYEMFAYDNYVNIDSELQLPPQLLYDNPELITTQLLEAEYKEFVYDNYLAVPDDVNMQEVRQEFEELLALAKENESPAYKLSILYGLRQMIADTAEYSLSPGKTPNNRDFVNYFLLENNKGYCTHYATAGVLLARMAGIPARYSAGYVVVGDDFNSSTKNEDGTYTIIVKDNRRHAWAEIYLDGYGWVPFEFTEGYTQQTIDTSPTTTTTTQTTTDHTETTTTEVSVSDEILEDSTEKTTENSNEKEATTTVVTEVVGDESGDHKPHVNPITAKILSVLFQILCFIIFIALIISFFLIRRVILIRKRNQQFAHKHTEKQIQYIYSYAEKLLNFKNIDTKNMSYAELADFMEEKYGDIYFKQGAFRGFIDTALCAVFSNTPPERYQNEQFIKLVNGLAEKIYQKSSKSQKLYLKYILCLI